MLVATVVLSAANADRRPLTDAEIRERALKLGMVDQESIKLSDLPGGHTQEGEQPKASEAPQESEPPKASEAPQESEPPKASEAPQESEPPEASGEPQESEPSQELVPVTIEIKGGATSYSVSKALEEAGLVEDAAAYDAFLCNNGYARSIRTGSYKILPGTGEEEIANMIAR